MYQYLWNGATWLREEDYPELYENKTMDAATNRFLNMLVSPFAVNYRRHGGLIPASTASASLYGALGGWPTGGTFSSVIDAVGNPTEGTVNRFTSSTSGTYIGYRSNATYQLVSRRAWNTSIKARIRASSTANTRLYIGFSSSPVLAISDSVLGNNEQGVIVGFNTVTADFSVFHNDGTDTMVTSSFGVARDTGWHTFEISMISSGDITCKIDDIDAVIMTRLPDNDRTLHANVLMELAADVETSIDIKAIQFNADK
jgi:hypothetical protein